MKRLFKIIVVLVLIPLMVTCTYYLKNKNTKTEVGVVPELPDVTITSISNETDFAPHVKVAGVIGKTIKFELLLPEDWNGKFVFGGGGGYVGSVINTALGYGVVEKGYATVGTDTGHEGHPGDGSWALNDLEAVVNFGHLGVHRTTVTSKAIIEAYYGQPITFSYFFGCSRGGGQALMEAQRYPDDFDGIVSGAPAYNWTQGVGAGFTHNQQQMYPDPNQLETPILSSKDLELIESSYLSVCDALDGIEDGILNNPLACNFDLNTLLCENGETENCLSQEQINAVIAIHQGPTNSNGPLYYGFPLGGETDPGGWEKWMTGGLSDASAGSFQAGIHSDYPEPVAPNAAFALGIDFMKYFIYSDPNWTYEGFNFENFDQDAQAIANALNATNPDLSEYRKNGGKLLMFTGWSDMAISPLGTIAYYQSVIDYDPTSSEDVKLFMMPGVMHCAGGPGPWWVNWIDEIDKWVTSQEAPEQMPAYFVGPDMQADGSRMICAYPNEAIYDGKGNTNDVSSFSCGQ